MARKAISNYIFIPSSKQVIIPDNVKLSDILMITNVTRNTVIYNFGDPTRGGSVAFTNATDATDLLAGSAGVSGGQAIFSNLNNGYTTLTLVYDTTAGSVMQAGDQLMIYTETSELKVRPYDFGLDAVERMKVGTPQSLIDADFEYGMQPTKWVQFPVVNDIPMTYEQPGTDVVANIFGYATFITGNSSGTFGGFVNGTSQTVITTVNQGDSALPTGPSAGMTTAFGGARYAMIIAQGQAGQPNCAVGTTYITNMLPVKPELGGSTQRTFSVVNTAGWNPGDIACVVEMPGEGLNFAGQTIGSNVVATVQSSITAGNTSLSIAAGTIYGNTIIFVETSQYNVWEAMVALNNITQTGAATNQTVIRNLWGTNAGNATIPTGARVRMLGNVNPAAALGSVYGNANVEIMRIDSVDSASQFSVTRSWFNVNASPTFGANSIVFKVNHTANPAGASYMSAGNIEIVRFSANSSAGTWGTPTQGGTTVNGFNGGAVGQLITHRGMFGTNPVTYAGPGSLFIPLTGMFAAGNISVPMVGAYVPNHGISTFSNANIASTYLSTVGFSQAVTVSNVEGVFVNQLTDNSYLKYYPKNWHNQLPGYPVSINDVQTVIRRGGLYSGANIMVANITSNIGSPSLITVTTVYPHGLMPGQAIQSQVHTNATGATSFAVPSVWEAATGQFVIQATPTQNTFQYVAKSNLIVQSTGIWGLAGNITMFPTGLVKHRPIDGGNNIGTNTPAHGYEMTRQTKKAFRYQSGKGIMFTSGTQFNPVFSIANIVASSTSIGATITVTTENEHGIQIGANVSIYGVSTSGYNTYYRVATVPAMNTFTVIADKAGPASTQPTWTRAAQGATDYAGFNFPRVVVTGWHGARIRSGIFDDGNGVFYEYDGAQFFAVKRTSTNDLAGRVNIAVGSNLVSGDVNTRFVDQLIAGDTIIIRGMTHTIAQVVDQKNMYITPVYRGTVNAQDARYIKVTEERTPQKWFNIDRADGTGPSGYVMNLTKMQMVGIQYTWYGAGFVDYMVRGVDGKMTFLHRSKGNNTNDEAYMRTGNLPARYQAVNKGPRTWTSKAVVPGATEIQLYDVKEFPAANVTYPVTVMIDNELIKYTGVFAANGNITGVTRGITSSQYVLGQSRSLWAGSNAGVNWQGGGMPSPQAWVAQAFNPNAGITVAISGYPSTSSATAYSADGMSWTAGGNLPSASTWIDIAYGRIGATDYMVAISNESLTGWAKGAYSTDNGQTWSNISVAPTTTPRWSSVAFGYDHTNAPMFMAVAGIGANSAATAKLTLSSLTPNGTGTAATNLNYVGPWSKITFGQVAVAGSTATSANVGKQNFFVTVGPKDNSNRIPFMNFTTDGGSTWGANIWFGASASDSLVTDVKYGNGLWMAIAGGLDQTAQSFGVASTAGWYAYGNPTTANWASMTMPGLAKRWRSLSFGPTFANAALGQWMAVADDTTVDNLANYGGGQSAYVNNMALGSTTAIGASSTNSQGVVPLWSSAPLPIGASWTNVVWSNGYFHAINGNVAASPFAANTMVSAISTQTALYAGAAATGAPNGNVWLATTLANTVGAGGTTILGNVRGIAYGVGNVVAVGKGNYAHISYNGGRQWANVASSTAGVGAGYMAGGVIGLPTYTSVAYIPFVGNVNQGRFVAISGNTNGGSTAVAVVDGSNLNGVWQTFNAATSTGLTVNQNWQAVAYTNGALIAVGGSATAGTTTTVTNYNNQMGVGLWTAVTAPALCYTDVAAGYVAGLSANNYCVVAVGGTTNSGATTVAAYSNVIVTANSLSSTSGTSILSLWGTATMPSSAVWQSVAYGNGYFVAVANGSTATAVSTNGGATWAAGGALPSSANWNKVAYGANGVWVAVSGSPTTRSTAAAYSVDNGTTWTASTLPTAQDWTNLVYSAQHGNWVAVSGDDTNLSANIAVSLNTGGLGASHTANTGVRVVSVTSSPDLNHWGSAIILDGGFTVDRTYTFTYNQTNYQPIGTQTVGAAITVFMMRLAPSLSNALTGNLGVKDLINRAQVLLNNMYVNIGGGAARFLLQGVLNPTNIATANWQPLNAAANFLQPSFTQFVANVGGTNPYPTTGAQITFTTGTAASGGEQLFSIPVSQGTAGFLDLSNIKEITGMVLPGTGAYPNGPEILAINIVPVVVSVPQSNVDVQITFIESQA